MSCNCSTPAVAPPAISTDFPALVDACPAAQCSGISGAATVLSPVCVSGQSLNSQPSPGYRLPTEYTDAIEDYNKSGITLLGRIGRSLAKLSGNGFLQIRNGLATVVQQVPLQVAALYHEWWKPAGINKRPIIGAPRPFYNQVIADAEGNLFAIQGLTGAGVTHDSLHVWSLADECWVTKQVADFPLLKRGLLPTSTAIELTGFEPIAANGAATEVRELTALAGSGIIMVNQQATIPSSCDCDGCEPQAAVASVATFLPFPTSEDEEATFTLKWNTSGPYWDED